MPISPKSTKQQLDEQQQQLQIKQEKHDLVEQKFQIKQEQMSPFNNNAAGSSGSNNVFTFNVPTTTASNQQQHVRKIIAEQLKSPTEHKGMINVICLNNIRSIFFY